MSGIKIKENGEYYDIIITHLVLRGTIPVNPRSFSRALSKSINSKSPGMVHNGNIISWKSGDRECKFSVPLDIEKFKGKKIRFFYPKSGVLVYMDKNLKEKIIADKKRISSPNNN